jgi:hypothetical protein
MTIALPAYIDKEAWEGLLEVRARLKAPNTAYALKLLLYEVQRIRDAGHDANAAIRQSALKGWKDIYIPKEKPIEAAPAKAVDETRALLAEWDRRNEESKRSVIPTDLLKLVKKA